MFPTALAIVLLCFAMKASSLSTPLASSQSLRKEKSDPSNIAVSSILDAIPVQIWDDAAASLLEKGVATVRLSTSAVLPQTNSATAETATPTLSLDGIHSRAFRSAREALDLVLYSNAPTNDTSSNASQPLLPMIAPEADSAHVTGFHHAGGMSRYNVRREGIVFSDNQCSCSGVPSSEFASDLSGMFWSLHGIADRILLAIETQLELCDSVLDGDDEAQDFGWFQRHLGPTETASQWHMKRFIVEEEELVENSVNDIKSAAALRTETGERITLPMHTDPSLISVVIHDSQGESIENTCPKESPGALGLQYFHPKEKKWNEPEAHGHLVATVFVGSVLAHLTCGKYPAAKHRVVETESHAERPLPKRMAATLFVRPQPSALLRVPLPSPWLLQQIEEEEAQKENESDGAKKKKKKSLAKPPITFDAWLKRVAKNYEKQKKRQNNKTKKAP